MHHGSAPSDTRFWRGHFLIFRWFDMECTALVWLLSLTPDRGPASCKRPTIIMSTPAPNWSHLDFFRWMQTMLGFTWLSTAISPQARLILELNAPADSGSSFPNLENPIKAVHTIAHSAILLGLVVQTRSACNCLRMCACCDWELDSWRGTLHHPSLLDPRPPAPSLALVMKIDPGDQEGWIKSACCVQPTSKTCLSVGPVLGPPINSTIFSSREWVRNIEFDTKSMESFQCCTVHFLGGRG